MTGGARRRAKWGHKQRAVTCGGQVNKRATPAAQLDSHLPRLPSARRKATARTGRPSRHAPNTEAAAHSHAVSHLPPPLIALTSSRLHPPPPIPIRKQHIRPSSVFSGSLLSKRKPELVEIGAALGLPTDDIRVTDLVKSIQAHLDANEAKLASDPTFKGLFYKKRS